MRAVLAAMTISAVAVTGCGGHDRPSPASGAVKQGGQKQTNRVVNARHCREFAAGCKSTPPAPNEARKFLHTDIAPALKAEVRSKGPVADFGRLTPRCAVEGKSIRCSFEISYVRGKYCTYERRLIYLGRAGDEIAVDDSKSNRRLKTTHGLCNLDSNGIPYVDQEYEPYE